MEGRPPWRSSLSSCTTQEPTNDTYFEQTIAPVLQTSCVHTNTGAGCHVADAKGNAFGNLDLSRTRASTRGATSCSNYGPYGQPSILVKNIPPFQITVQLYDGTTIPSTTDIKHSGGPILDPTASAYQVLAPVDRNGASENNSGPPPASTFRLPCTDTIGTAPGFTAAVAGTDPATADFATFKARSTRSSAAPARRATATARR